MISSVESEPAAITTATAANTIGTSYDTTCATARIAPSSENLLRDAQPPMNSASTLAVLTALHKADAHSVQPLPVPAAVAQLVRVAPFVIAQADNGARVMALCADLAQRTFVGELRFRKDADFWRLIDEQVALVPNPA